MTHREAPVPCRDTRAHRDGGGDTTEDLPVSHGDVRDHPFRPGRSASVPTRDPNAGVSGPSYPGVGAIRTDDTPSWTGRTRT